MPKLLFIIFSTQADGGSVEDSHAQTFEVRHIPPNTNICVYVIVLSRFRNMGKHG
jgi:hypothetical protein